MIYFTLKRLVIIMGKRASGLSINSVRLLIMLDWHNGSIGFDDLILQVFDKGWYNDWRNTYYEYNGIVIRYVSPSLMRDLEQLEKKGYIEFENNKIVIKKQI